MIPASVSQSTHASASTAGVLFPLIEPSSAEFAEFGQLLGDASQSLTMTALSTPALTLSVSRLNKDLAESSPTEAELSPESLLFTLTQGAVLALQPPTQPANPSATESVASSQGDAMLGQIATVGSSAGFMQPSTSSLVIPAVATGAANTVFEHASPSIPQPNTLSPVVINTLQTSSLVGQQPAASVVPQVLDSEVLASSTPISVVGQPVPVSAHAVGVANSIASSAAAVSVGNSVSPVMTTSLAPTSEMLSVQINSLVSVSFSNLAPNFVQQKASHATVSTNTPNLSLLADEVSSPSLTSPSTAMSRVLTTDQAHTGTTFSPLVASPNTAQPIAQAITPHVAQPVESKAATVTQQANLIANAQAEAKVTGEPTVESLPILGDTKSVVFAAAPVISSTSASSVMQAASASIDVAPSTQANASSALSMAMSLATAADSSSSREQAQQGGKDDPIMPLLSDAPAEGDADATTDGFSLVAASPLSSSPSASPLLAAPLNLRHPQWTQEVAQRMQVMVNQSMNELEVRLDPLDLGPMKIKLALDEHQKAHVTLSAQHGLTRDMLENALPRLKELLAQSGIELASATVDSGQQNPSQGQENARSGNNGASELTDEAANHQVGMTVVRSTENIVDQYA